MTTVLPTHLELAGEDRLQIAWSDGLSQSYAFRRLREACPCATCREKRQQAHQPAAANLLPVLAPGEAQPLKILGMRPVGSYAYSIKFSDGHDTGIYSFDLLRALGEPAAS